MAKIISLYTRVITFLGRVKLWEFCLICSILVGGMALRLAWVDSYTADESVHASAGYIHVRFGDFRSNPEHPPLLKILSGFSTYSWSRLSGTDIDWDPNNPDWSERVQNGNQMGRWFMMDNRDVLDELIFWSRLPSVFVFLGMAWYVAYLVYSYTKNTLTAIVAGGLVFFSVPLLGHSYLVTTDIISSFGFLVVTDRFVKYLQEPSWCRSLFLAGGLLFAALSKFSVALLGPVFFLIWVIFLVFFYGKTCWRRYGQSILHMLLVVIIVILGISLVYAWAMRNMAFSHQYHLIRASLWSGQPLSVWGREFLLEMIEYPFFRPFAHYLLGVFMAVLRVSSGSVTFLLGNLTTESFETYFPVVYLVKESLVVIGLLLFSVGYTIYLMIRKSFAQKRLILPKASLFEWVLLIVILWYWVVSIDGNLNLGVRHLFPAVIMMYVLLTLRLFPILQELRLKWTLLILGMFYVSEIFVAFPHWISHMNLLTSGFDYRHEIVVDSNVDWGQDLKRLHEWVEENDIKRIHIEYFGAADIWDYFDRLDPDRKVIEHVVHMTPPEGGYFALSATWYQNRYKPIVNNDGNQYWYLAGRKPDYMIGDSILIFDLDAQPFEE